MQPDRWVVAIGDSTDSALVGGKAVNLGRLLGAGFPVPGGFVVTTDAFRAMRTSDCGAALREAISQAYAGMGRPSVAVRSSATAEDLAHASMAGQYDTFLDIEGDDALWSAIGKCWDGLENPRLHAYLEENKIPRENVAMAVVVQRLVPADAAGVLFTTDPNTGNDDLLVESSWGLGESVVSGNVQPDIFRIAADSGAVLDVRIGSKKTWLAAGHREEMPVEPERQGLPSLNARQLDDLWKLGLRAARYFERPQDIEWAFSEDTLFFLQSRDITTLASLHAKRSVLENVRTQLRERLAVEPTASWVVHNMAETLPHPTPLTWSVLQPFMAGAGGFGNLYRQAGFEPSDRIRESGFLEKIGGRIYMDLSLAPEMFFTDFPFAYDREKVRTDPDAGQLPPTVPKGSLGARIRAGRRLAGVESRLNALSETLDRDLRDREFPEFVAWVAEEKQTDLAALDAKEWSALWDRRVHRVLDEFAPRSLLPGLVLAHARNHLHALIDEEVGDHDADALVNELAVGSIPDQTTLFNQRLRDLSLGECTLEEWMTEFGHRASGEFDLAAPRWRERPDAVVALGEHLRDGTAPLEMFKKRAKEAAVAKALVHERLPEKRRKEFDDLLALQARYVPFREDGKHFLMLGYDLLRDLMREAVRHLDIPVEDVFLLELEEVRQALRTGFPPLTLLEERRRMRTAEARLQLPAWIGAEEIDQLGQAPQQTTGASIKALSIAAGLASGPARIVTSPDEAGAPGKGYVLVCPSTDPSWTPLFVNAAALVLERGGTLSHGAVVAREMGLPAVVLPGALSLLREGEEILVDGNHGMLLRKEEGGIGTETESPAHSLAIHPTLRPPPPGPAERRANRLRDSGLIVWGIYLVAFFLLPAPWVHDPSLHFLDLVLWPLIAKLGYVGGTAAIAAGLGFGLILLQRLITDTPRLREAKKRSAALTSEANSLPEKSPRREVLTALAKPANSRIAASAFVPLSLLLGPLVVIFSWLMLRVDPATWSPPPGSPITLQAVVDSNWRNDISLNIPPELTVSEATPTAQKLPPIRETLEDLRTEWRKTTDLSEFPWDVRAAAAATRRTMLADLDAYLQRGVPPETITWLLSSDAEADGKFEVRVTAGDRTLAIPLVLGRNAPPAPHVVDGDGALRQLLVTYPPRPPGSTFWQPLGFNIGWLWVYLLSYTPSMFLTKWLLRVP